jgi:hypothetical protein
VSPVWQPSGVTTAPARTIRLGSTDYPVVPPSIRDPRLHLASVIITIHVLGQTALGFRVSVPQIVVAILTCALIEVVLTFRATKLIVWPASAMLTGSGVALILRIVGQERSDHWTWSGWYLFAAVAGFSLLTKYLVRYRGNHVFNPSNVGLVVAFLVLGSDLIEPLDFWWAPLDPWMALAYLVILIGGLLITKRLRLLALAVTFWLGLGAGVGALVGSGHCMSTAWSLQPVCGSYFWWVIVTSPEVLIFLFFMITDPKTIPRGRVARVAFALCLALACTLLMAPQTTEFGAKVGLLGGLVLMTPLRSLFDRVFAGESWQRRARSWPTRPRALFAPGALLGGLLVIVPMGIVLAGAPARGAAPTAATETTDVEIDPVRLPTVSVGEEVPALAAEIDPDELARHLAEDLRIESDALLSGDTSILRSADDGERLVEMERAVEVAATLGRHVVQAHTFDTMHLDVVFTDGPQGGASLGLVATGTRDLVTYDAAGAEQARESGPFAATFVMRRGPGERWLIVSEVDDG